MGWRLYWFMDFLAFLGAVIGTVLLLERGVQSRLQGGGVALTTLSYP